MGETKSSRYVLSLPVEGMKEWRYWLTLALVSWTEHGWEYVEKSCAAIK